MQSLLEFMNRDRLKKYKRYNYFPKDKDELIEIIEQLIKERGYEADLNDIDTSGVEDMSYIFTGLHGLQYFNGDISKWDVSNVYDMYRMFFGSDFNRDISGWDVRNVKNMQFMFESSKFDRDIKEWKVNTYCDTNAMFHACPLESHPPTWYHK